MYNEYFGFKEAPFSIAPDPHYLFMTGQHREALAHLVYGLNSEGGCILLTGEVGTGKTTVCRCLLEQVPEEAKIALVLNPKVTEIELLETICDELSIDYPEENNSVKTYTDRINEFLLDANARNEKTVLIIDEAQNLSDAVLEQLRLLTNLETNQRKLLQIIILGQPELLELLSRKEMRQLAQRITARYHLEGLSRRDLNAYISHRLAVAGQHVRLFPDATINQLYKLSNGIPRLVNILCDRALLGTYVQGQHIVDKKTLNTAAIEVFGELKNTEHKPCKIRRVSQLVIIASLSAIAIMLNNQWPNLKNSFAEPDKTLTLTAAPDKTLTLTAESTKTAELTTINNTTPPETILKSIPETALNQSSEPQENNISPITETVDSIEEYISELSGNNAKHAYTELFKTWKINHPINSVVKACSFAKQQGFNCFHTLGKLESLQKLNRPVVLKLYSDNGEAIYIFLNQMDATTVSFTTASGTINTSISTLSKHWFGEYSMLWKKPPFYLSALNPGDKGSVVQWLDQQLSRIYGQNTPPEINNIYSDEMISRVKTFQQDHGLVPDGIAGPLTFIHLNNAIGIKTPTLSVSKNQEPT